MDKSKFTVKPLGWWTALMLAALVTGCWLSGGGGNGINNPAPTSPGAGTGTGLPGGHGPAPVVLGTAGSFVILTKTGITNTASHTSAVSGNIGASPVTSAAMDNVFCSEITGTIYGVDATYTGSGTLTCFLPGTTGVTPNANKTFVDTAVLDMGTAYTNAAGRTADFSGIGAGEIGGMTLPAGTYKWGTGVSVNRNVILNGGPNDVWIFQVAQGITVASGVNVILTGGALAKNVFWQSFGAVNLGTTSHMEGVILSQTAITLNTGASANSRLFAQTAVSLDANAVTQPAP